MARFNLNDYETVEERIRRFYAEYPDGRIITENLTTPHDRERGEWVVKTTVYLSEGAQANGLAKATGLAFERDGGNGANATAALENCETSSIGRCLANMNLSGNKRASREEMQKAARNDAVQPPIDVNETIEWAVRYAKVRTVEEARALYQDALAENATTEVLKSIEQLGKKLSSQ